MYKFVVVGGGTAGMMAASLIKTYYGDQVEVTAIYDHKNPGIGVGESLTPFLYQYLNYVGITREELVKNVHATVKLGLKFKNWLNDGNYYFHNFNPLLEPNDSYNMIAMCDIANECYDNDIGWGYYPLENSRIPLDHMINQSLHIDAVLFSRYVEDKFKDRIVILDGLVDAIEFKPNTEEINNLILKDGRKIKGDFFIDASGFQYALFKHLDNTWVDKRDWMPINRCIPNPMPWDFTTQPTYTTSEASDQGWILQVPLSNRWGTGYLYASEFCSDEQAFENFENFLQKNYGKSLNNTSKVLKFNSGYWNRQWIGNCIAVGLSSGFAEPLEATNIHHTIFQLWRFINVFNFKIYTLDQNLYNKDMQEFYHNAYLFLRFCYTTGRQDSEFWKFLTNNTPDEIKFLDEKSRTDNIHIDIVNGPIFRYRNFTRVAYGLNKISAKSAKRILDIRQNYERASILSSIVHKTKQEIYNGMVDHKQYINSVLTGQYNN